MKIGNWLRWSRRKRGDELPHVLILTPIKDAGIYVGRYCELLLRLSYPKDRISVALLESDSRDQTVNKLEQHLPTLRWAFRRVSWWKEDMGFLIPPSMPRWNESIQLERRVALAKSRNRLLFRALEDEEWVLWLDADVIDYPPDIVQRLLAAGKDILQPHCVLEPNGPTFDRNAWTFAEGRRRYMEEMRNDGEFVRLDAVGGTMLLVRAGIHRDGLIFPPYPHPAPFETALAGHVETEGLGIMAAAMGHTCWGMPNLEILHSRL